MAKSIIQVNKDRCYLCGRPAMPLDPLDKHHVFFGPLRRKSEKYGLTVYLHHFTCHIFGGRAVHNNSEVCRALESEVQGIAMAHYGWTTKDFIQLFGRNYIQGKPAIEANNCCVMCGEIVPEGRQMCLRCERTCDE